MVFTRECKLANIYRKTMPYKQMHAIKKYHCVYLRFEWATFISLFLRLVDLKEFKRTLHSAFDREKFKFFKNVLERGIFLSYIFYFMN